MASDGVHIRSVDDLDFIANFLSSVPLLSGAEFSWSVELHA